MSTVQPDVAVATAPMTSSVLRYHHLGPKAKVSLDQVPRGTKQILHILRASKVDLGAGETSDILRPFRSQASGI